MTFKPIPDYPAYEINEEGVIRNINRQRELKPQRVNKYLRVQLGRTKGFYIHQLVLMTFVGPAEGRVCRHIDGDPHNNSLANLEYGSPRDNTYDRQHHGTWGTKLTERHVRVIRGLWNCGFKRPRLSEIFGVTPHQITQITQRHSWAYLD